MADDDKKQYLPSCWEDDVKMTAYLSPFRTTTANPEGVASKILFWQKCIHAFCQKTKRCCFTVDDIIKAFTKNLRPPQCIPTVIEEMVKSREICEFNAFMQIKPINKPVLTWGHWAWELGKAPVSWTWNRVKNAVLPPPPSAELKYVNLQAIKDKADEVLNHASDLKGNVVPLAEIIEKCQWPNDGIADAMLAIYWLYCQNKAAVMNFDFNTPSQVLVKLATSNETNVSITDKDVCKYDLLKLIEKTEAKIAEYEEKCNKAKEEALVLSKKSRVLALNQLKKKKMFEAVIQKEANILMNMQSLLEKLNDIDSNKEVIMALKTANAAIKHVQKESNLTEDTVMDVMDDLRETIETQEIINTTISQSIVPEDNEDLEKEFDSLMKDLATEDDLCKWVENLKLPDLPEPKSASTAPTASETSEKVMESETS